MPDGSHFPPEAAPSASAGFSQVDFLLRMAEVEKQVGLGRSAIYRRMADGTFPEPVALGGGQVRWRQSDIRDWVQARPKVSFRATPRSVEE